MFDILYVLSVIVGSFLASFIFVCGVLFIRNMINIFIFRTIDSDEVQAKNVKFLRNLGPILWVLLMVYFFFN